MTMKTRSLAAAVVAVFLAMAGQAVAADPPASTVTIPEMDCASCAKKIGGKLVEVPGVAKAEYDLKARTIKVAHKLGETPSPKALWEAVEKGGKDPSKLEVPGGTHTKKPTS